MLDKKKLEEIKKIIEEFFEKMTFAINLEEIHKDEQTIFVKLKADDPQILIGEKGQVLSEIQRLLKAILKKRIEESFFIDIDINDYKKKKAEYLREMARMTADEVALTKKEKKLPAMPAYERRIIHLELADRNDVTTESIGKEPERQLVIKPYP